MPGTYLEEGFTMKTIKTIPLKRNQRGKTRLIFCCGDLFSMEFDPSIKLFLLVASFFVMTDTAFGWVTVPTNVSRALSLNIPQTVIVQFKDDAVKAKAQASASSRKLKRFDAAILDNMRIGYAAIKSRALIGISAGIRKKMEYDHLPMTAFTISDTNALFQLALRSDVMAIFENVQHQTVLTESLPLIMADVSRTLRKTGAGTTVAVLDTGVDFLRPAFGSCTAPNTPSSCRVVFSQDFALSDGVNDDNGHGTNVSGITVGVAPDTRIAGLDVFTRSGAATVDIIHAIEWVIANQQKFNIVAMNLSLGVRNAPHSTECAGSWATIPFANARAVGVIPVVATGNDGFVNGISEPACAPGAVRVGAVYDFTGPYNDNICSDSAAIPDKVTCFSNSALGMVTLLAPGSRITAAGATSSGTSQATPHVAGAIAVLRATDAFPEDSLDETIARLSTSGTPITDTRNNVVVPRINLAAIITPPMLNGIRSLLLIDQEPSSIKLSLSSPIVVTGRPITLTATVAGDIPTGVVQFKDNGNNLGTPVPLVNKVAALTTTALKTLGTHTITAAYAGDDSNLASTAPAVAVKVTPVVAPVAKADLYLYNPGKLRTVAAPGLLGNDTGTKPLTSVLVTGTTAAQGSVTVNATGGFTFSPAVGFIGNAGFSYLASNSASQSAPATATLKRNLPPTVVGETCSYTRTSGAITGTPATACSVLGLGSIKINLLSNDVDANALDQPRDGLGTKLKPNSVVITNLTGATLVNNKDGTVTATVASSSTGFSFNYSVTDTLGLQSAKALVSVSVK